MGKCCCPPNPCRGTANILWPVEPDNIFLMDDAVRSIDWQNSAREYWAAREKRKYSTSGSSQGKHCVLGHARPSNRQSCPCPCDCRKAPGREPCSTALAGWQRFQENIIHGDNSGNTGWQGTSEVDKLGPAFPMPLCWVVILGELPGKYFRRCFCIKPQLWPPYFHKPKEAAVHTYGMWQPCMVKLI